MRHTEIFRIREGEAEERSLHGSQTRLRILKEMHRSFTAPNEVPEKIYKKESMNPQSFEIECIP